MLNAKRPSPADEAAILDLLARYSSCADRVPSPQGWAGCFTADAVVRIFSPRRDAPLVLTGVDRIGSAFQNALPRCRQVHLVTNTIIAVDGPAAWLDSCFARLDIDRLTVVLASFGRYHDRATRTDTGLWKLTARDIHIVSRVASR